jgi:hypothetical protein
LGSPGAAGGKPRSDAGPWEMGSCSGHAQVCLRRQRGSLRCSNWQHSPWHRGRWKSSGMAVRWETKKEALISCHEPSTAPRPWSSAIEQRRGIEDC